MEAGTEDRGQSRSETYILCAQLKRLRNASHLASQLMKDIDRPQVPTSLYQFRPKARQIAPLQGPAPFLGVGFEALSLSVDDAKTQRSSAEKSKKEWKQQRESSHKSALKSNSTLPLLPALRRPGYQWARAQAEDRVRGKVKKPLRLALSGFH